MNRAHLGAETVADIRRRHAAGYSVKELAKAFGRSRLAISRIVKGETYKRVDADTVAAFAPLPTKRGGGAARLVERIRAQANPATVRQAPAPAPTTIYHLGSAKDGPRCGVAVGGRLCEYGTSIQELQELGNMGVGVCQKCFEIGKQAHRDMFPPGPMGVF